jgi:sulfur-carrier protein
VFEQPMRVAAQRRRELLLADAERHRELRSSTYTASVTRPRRGEAMPELVLTRVLAVQTMGELEYDVPSGTVRDALTSVFERQPTLRRYLLADDGALRRHVNIFVNEELIEDRRGLSDSVGDGDRIHVLQAVSGGER